VSHPETIRTHISDCLFSCLEFPVVFVDNQIPHPLGFSVVLYQASLPAPAVGTFNNTRIYAAVLLISADVGP
jgi:hypothetical protein